MSSFTVSSLEWAQKQIAFISRFWRFLEKGMIIACLDWTLIPSRLSFSKSLELIVRLKLASFLVRQALVRCILQRKKIRTKSSLWKFNIPTHYGNSKPISSASFMFSLFWNNKFIFKMIWWSILAQKIIVFEMFGKSRLVDEWRSTSNHERFN